MACRLVVGAFQLIVLYCRKWDEQYILLNPTALVEPLKRNFDQLLQT